MLAVVLRRIGLALRRKGSGAHRGIAWTDYYRYKHANSKAHEKLCMKDARIPKLST